MNKTLTAPSSLTFQFCKITITPISTQTFKLLGFSPNLGQFLRILIFLKSESTEIPC